MNGPAQPVERARIGPFEVNFQLGELRKNGVRLKIHDQPLEILAMLLSRPGELVTREEIRQRLWPSGTFVDFDNGLNSAINRLRGVLGDSAESPKFIETIPRRGYRFIAEVSSNEHSAPAQTDTGLCGWGPPGRICRAPTQESPRVALVQRRRTGCRGACDGVCVSPRRGHENAHVVIPRARLGVGHAV
jgi:DNA-binding winged helix-turn-helix (wHTH) protein